MSSSPSELSEEEIIKLSNQINLSQTIINNSGSDMNEAEMILVEPTSGIG